MSTRIKGKNVVFELAGTDYADDITTVTLESEEAESDVTTFADAAAGGATDWYFRGTAIQSTDASAFWSYLWDNNGATGVTYVFAPHGNATPSASQPHYTGTVSIGRKPSVGGAADETWTFDFEIQAEQEPTVVTV